MANKKLSSEDMEKDNNQEEIIVLEGITGNNEIDNYIMDLSVSTNNFNLHNYLCFSVVCNKIGKRYRVNTDDLHEMDDRFDSYLNLCVACNHEPTEVEFAQFMGIHRSTLWDWQNRTRQLDKERSDTIKKWKQFFEGELTQYAMSMRNPAGAIFLLKNNHQYTDKQEISIEPKQQFEGKSMEELAREIPEIPIEEEE